MQMNLLTKQKQSPRHKKQTWLPREKGMGGDKLGVGVYQVHFITHIK